MSSSNSNWHGAERNVHGGLYIRGRAHDILRKLQVAEEYKAAAAARGGNVNVRPNIRRIAEKMQVSESFVVKIEGELLVHGSVLSPEEIRTNAIRQRGPGAYTLTDVDCFVLYQLYVEEPYRLLRSYRDWLLYFTGTDVSMDTISNFFKHGLPFRGSLVKPNLVPWDKLTTENTIRAYEFIEVLRTLNPNRVIFCDEKHLKGEEFWSKRVRRDPTTGDVPAIRTCADFRNTYTIIGLCTMNDEKPAPVYYRIRKGTNDAEAFFDTIRMAVDCGFLVKYDVLVLDNAKIHTEQLVEWLWYHHKILVLFLPTRSPEWNPKELVWRMLCTKLASYPVHDAMEMFGNDNTTARTAAYILDNITFDDIRKFFKICFHFISTTLSN